MGCKLKTFLFLFCLSISIFSFISPAYAYTFEDGFETGFTPWTQVGSPVIVTNPVHHGVNASGFDATGDYLRKDITETNTCYMRGYFRLTGLPGNTKSTTLMDMLWQSTYVVMTYIIRTSGTLYIAFKRYYPTTVTVTTAFAFAVDTWYCIEAFTRLESATNGSYAIWIDGNLIWNITGLDTTGSPGGVSRTYWGRRISDYTFSYEYLDCCVINTSYIGPETEEGQEITENLYGTMKAFSSVNKDLETYHRLTSTFTLFSYLDMAKEVPFKLYATTKVLISLDYARALGFTLSQTINIFSFMDWETQISGAGQNLAFILYGTVETLASLKSEYALKFILYGAVKTWASLRSNNAWGFILSEATYFFGSIKKSIELSRILAQTIKPLAYLLSSFEGVSFEYAFILFENVLTWISQTPTYEYATLSVILGIAGLALILALIAIALIFLMGRKD